MTFSEIILVLLTAPTKTNFPIRKHSDVYEQIRFKLADTTKLQFNSSLNYVCVQSMSKGYGKARRCRWPLT